MNDTGIVLCIVAIAAIAADVIVRLVIAPRRREKFMEELLDCIVEPEPEIETTMVRLQAVALPEEVAGFRELKKTRLGE
jgi:hypothetical protein